MSASLTDREPRTPKIARILSPIEEFVHAEAFGGLLLIGAALAALLVANSPLSSLYFSLRDADINISVGGYSAHLTVKHIVNDGLMALFFFVVGLEIKRELVLGELNSIRKAVLPVVAATGGMLLPALVFALFNAGRVSESGWAIPMATDIAFALGVLSAVGPRIPFAARVFLTSIAIIDDIGAIIVIAVFYSTHLVWSNVLGTMALLFVLVVMNRLGVVATWPYGLVGTMAWMLLLGSGIHATIAGVLVAATIPVTSRISAERFQQVSQLKLLQFEKATKETATELIDSNQHDAINELRMTLNQIEPPTMRLQNVFHPWSTLLIMPLFAFINGGISFSPDISWTSPLSLGIFAGLLVGKPLGIWLACWFTVRAGLAQWPRLSQRQLLGVISLSAIGFTMSVFISNLAFASPELTHNATGAIIIASFLAAIAGITILRSEKSAAAD